MKKFLILSLFTLVCSFAINAQTTQGRENVANNMTFEESQSAKFNKMLNRLKVSFDQKDSESVQKAEAVLLIIIRQETERLTTANKKGFEENLQKMNHVVKSFENFNFDVNKVEEGKFHIAELIEFGNMMKEARGK
jgi:uncharacterized ferredoxin-like protein